MKKIIVLVCFLFLTANSLAFADEVIDSKGVIIPCKIETVGEDFIEYSKDGRLYSFVRKSQAPVFNDYIEVKNHLLKEDTQRLFGKVLIRDLWGVKINTNDGLVDIPFYRIKLIGIYKP